MNVLKKNLPKKEKRESKPVIVSNKPILSIIIPCYNCRNYIERLLDSIVNQSINLPIEVIIQDDFSTDKFMELVEPYKSKLNIRYFKNKKREIHCPSNTRLDGMAHAKGEWITFIDNDDMFERDAFKEFYECTQNHKERTLIVTEFREYNAESEQFGKTYDVRNITWLHGKFYYKKFLKEYNIKFKENLESNEDLFFNMSAFAAITAANLNYSMLKVYTYRWVYNENSISRTMFKDRQNFYIDKYYSEYLHASIDPWWNLLGTSPNLRQYIFKRSCYVLLYGYFYYQALFFRNGFKHVRSNRDIFEEFLLQIKSKFDASTDDICDIIYNDADMYNRIREDAANGAMNFVEAVSFYDFISRF